MHEVKSVGQIVAESPAIEEAKAGRLPTGRIEIPEGFHTKSLSSDGASGGALIEPTRVQGVLAPARPRLTVRDLIPAQPVTSTPVEWTREASHTRAAAGVAEGQLKPEGDMTFELLSESPQVIAVVQTVTRQLLADAPRLRQHVDGALMFDVKLEEEQQFLYGDGVAPNQLGILNTPGILGFDAATEAETGDTKLDVLRRALTKVSLANMVATGVILHPNDREDIDLLKSTGSGDYVSVDVSTGGPPSYWRLGIVETSEIVQGTALIGAFSQGAVIYDRESATIEAFEQYSDYPRRNLVLLRAEERTLLTVTRPTAFCEVTFAPEV